jgi:hypothetical protein
MWWTHFGAGDEHDAFQAATNHLFVDTPDSPSGDRNGGPPFALDGGARLRDLAAAGFVAPEVDLWRWTLRYDTTRLVGLYRTFSPIHALEPKNRKLFLRELARIADEQFGGCVERPFITVLYTAQRVGDAKAFLWANRLQFGAGGVDGAVAKIQNTNAEVRQWRGLPAHWKRGVHGDQRVHHL